MTEKRLNALCREWQGMLMLTDWRVTARMVPVGEMESCSHRGNIEYCDYNKAAKIKLIRPDHYDGLLEYDVEETLIHELLHLHFSLFAAKTGTRKDLAQERAINAIAAALLAAKRAPVPVRPDKATAYLKKALERGRIA